MTHTHTQTDRRTHRHTHREVTSFNNIDIRSSHNFQDYLNYINSKLHRQALSRLIMSAHCLNVEAGRWARPVIPLIERHCVICPGKIEDEFHFLFECTLYNELRQQYIPRYYACRPSMHKLVNLFDTCSKKTMRSVAKYVYLAFQSRSRHIAEITN